MAKHSWPNGVTSWNDTWNLRSLFLAWMCPWRIIPTDCHMQVTSPSCCLPKVHVDRALRCTRLQIWLSHSLVRFYSRSWRVASTADQINRSGCRAEAVAWRIIFLRSSRVLLAHVGRALGLMRIINMCRLVPACGTMAVNLRDYGMPHCWKTLHPLRIEMCGRFGCTSRGRPCGTGTITCKDTV